MAMATATHASSPLGFVLLDPREPLFGHASCNLLCATCDYGVRVTYTMVTRRAECEWVCPTCDAPLQAYTVRHRALPAGMVPFLYGGATWRDFAPSMPTARSMCLSYTCGDGVKTRTLQPTRTAVTRAARRLLEDATCCICQQASCAGKLGGTLYFAGTEVKFEELPGASAIAFECMRGGFACLWRLGCDIGTSEAVARDVFVSLLLFRVAFPRIFKQCGEGPCRGMQPAAIACTRLVARLVAGCCDGSVPPSVGALLLS